MNTSTRFRKTIKNLYLLLDPKQKRNFILILFIMTGSSALTQFTPKAIGWLTDDILSQTSIQFIKVIPVLLLILIVTVFNELLKILRRILVEDTATKTEKKARNLAIVALLKAPLSYFKEHMTGNIHGRLNRCLEGTINLEKLLDGYTWLHLSGITPALGLRHRKMIMDCLKTAKKNGMTVSFDGNFRSTLWSWEEARGFCTACLPYVDVLMGIEPYHLWKEENNHSAGDVKDDIPFQPDLEQQEIVFNAFVKRYPNLKCIARHVRYSPSCSENSLKAYLWYQGKTYESRKLTFNILDRVGGGDAFVSGIIYALMQEFSPEDIVNFGVASSAIKHTLHGDGNITDDVSLIRHVMQMNFDIKR